MADAVLGVAAHAASRTGTVRHSAIVRVTHWITTACFLALLVSGMEIVISHPRFYWGENGNVLTPALFSFPIPSSRATVPTERRFAPVPTGVAIVAGVAAVPIAAPLP